MSLRNVFVAALLFTGGLALAQEAQEGGREPARRPPPEAFDACAGLDNYSACLIRLKDRDVTGTCHPTPGAKLVCVPATGRPPGADSST